MKSAILGMAQRLRKKLTWIKKKDQDKLSLKCFSDKNAVKWDAEKSYLIGVQFLAKRKGKIQVEDRKLRLRSKTSEQNSTVMFVMEGTWNDHCPVIHSQPY